MVFPLRENHSGMETCIPALCSVLVFSLRENHSGMETDDNPLIFHGVDDRCVRTIVVWKREAWP